MFKSSKKNLLIVQPHSDDVIFSVSEFVKRRGEFKRAIILTVEYNEKRLEEDRQFCLEHDFELMVLKTKVSSENFHKEYYSDKKLMSDDSAWDFCLGKIGEKKMEKLANELDLTLSNMSDKFLIITCLGVGHPFHWLTRMLTQDNSDLFYRDFPHSYKRRNKEYFVGLTNTEFKLSFSASIHPKKGSWLKFDQVKQFYKSQSSLLFFEKGYMDKMLPEEYYEKVEN